MAKSIRDLLRVPIGTVRLADYDSSRRPGASSKDGAERKDFRQNIEWLHELHERLWAESRAGGNRALLLVLQGMDTCGKGGTTEHVVGAFGPIGVQYTGFKKPTDEELAHDFLWRVDKRVPAPGVVGVFDRSHYEDVLPVRVHNLIPPSKWEPRYDRINEWEAGLVAHGVTVVKCFLHISYDEQRKRLLERLADPDKHWKFNEADIDERGFWNEYVEAYEDVLTRCNTDTAPWYLVPADDKKYRNWAVSELLREILEEMDPHWPRPPLDVERLRKRLAPPS